MSNEQWNQGQAELQKKLAPGMAANDYRRKLEKLGYKITATNYNDSDYVEYEVVKGDQTWEVQIDVNEDTRQATSVDIAQNVWKTDATEAALTHNRQLERTAAGSTQAERQRARVMRNNQYSDRDRASVDQMVNELEGLSVGRDKQYYKDALRQRGYEITKINEDDTDVLELEAVKDGRSVQMEVDFDEDTGRSTEVDASSLWAESESTTRTREQQEMGQTSHPSTGRMTGESRTHMSDPSQTGERRSHVTPDSSLSERTPDTTSGMERRSQAGSYEDR
jgi:uncharacterized protein YmfQ (DUF2313 family)